MTLTVHIDGWPYRINFSGTLDVQRLESGDVAVRKASDDATVKVELDEEELARSRKLIRDMRIKSTLLGFPEYATDTFQFNGISREKAEELQKAYDDAWRGR